MAMSKFALERARSLRIAALGDGRWELLVIDPRFNQGTPVQRYLARNLIDVVRVARSYMGSYSIPRELVKSEDAQVIKALGYGVYTGKPFLEPEKTAAEKPKRVNAPLVPREVAPAEVAAEVIEEVVEEIVEEAPEAEEKVPEKPQEKKPERRQDDGGYRPVVLSRSKKKLNKAGAATRADTGDTNANTAYGAASAVHGDGEEVLGGGD